MTDLICPYCGSNAVLQDSSVIWHGTSYGPMWVCAEYPECDAYVGCHPGTETPLGRLADKKLRKWKILAHRALSRYWQNGKNERSYVYKRLAKALGIDETDCHIGMFDLETCKRVMDLCTKKR